MTMFLTRLFKIAPWFTPHEFSIGYSKPISGFITGRAFDQRKDLSYFVTKSHIKASIYF
jgi:hypothetical protein